MLDAGLKFMLYHLDPHEKLENNYVKIIWLKFLEAKCDSGELRCPATAVIKDISCFPQTYFLGEISSFVIHFSHQTICTVQLVYKVLHFSLVLNLT